jgi:hypothetical protein
MINSFNKKIFYIVLISSVLLWLSACATGSSSVGEAAGGNGQQSSSADQKNMGTLLIFSEREAGSESFTTRIFVNAKYMRMSGSLSPADFVLFDRAERTIYNVVRDEKSILVIRDRPHNVKPPIEIKYEEKSQPSSAIPKINGRQATHYRFFANGKRCYDSVVIGEDFMPDVLAALREFRQVLANEHASSVNNVPREMMDACDMAVNVFHATKHMDHGLPIREWNTKGYQRFLKDYRENISAPASSFELPKDYEQFSMSDAPPLVGH